MYKIFKILTKVERVLWGVCLSKSNNKRGND